VPSRKSGPICPHLSSAARLALLLLCFPVACAASNGTAYSICDLARDASLLNNTTVRVKAVFETDLLEMSGLSDARCPGVHMALEDPPASVKKHRSLEAFDKAVYGDVRDLRLRRFEIEFTGTFRWDATPGPREVANGLEKPRGSLKMRRIWTYARWRT
jgi:hypothetical protein